MNTDLLKQYLKQAFYSGIGAPIIVVLMMAMMIVPLPPFILDILFTFNISLSLIVLLAVIYCGRPLDFAIFPTVLLVTTLLRLSLNVASTRVVLLNGHTGSDAAGTVVKAFGEVVIGGNYAVGLVVFAVLVVINFVVVTKGAGRVSEVSARFTLDALPGKQMAIDADLNSGLINQAQAKIRREEVAQEADFYGAMDGSSKFVRGDAIAGILILFINLAGGLLIGMLQHDLDFSSALQNYALLTIGDGLVAQIPSLLLSTAAAIIVTRVSKSHDMGGEVTAQVFNQPRSLVITGSIIAGLGVIPGMPHIVFLLFAGIFFGAAYYLLHKPKTEEETRKPIEVIEQKPIDENKELGWDDVNVVDTIGLEMGYRLIPLVDNKQSGQLLNRVKGVRRKLSGELGFLLPVVHIRDNLDITPNIYRVTVAGVVAGEGTVHPNKLMAINPGQVFGELDGVRGRDPAFGLEAVWIEEAQRENAQNLGYTVVDPCTVIATHVSHLLKQYSHLLLGFEEVQQLLDRLKKSAPKLVSELIPDCLSLSVIVKVLQRLLEESIPITDMRTIAETLTQVGHRSKDPEVLVSAVRSSLSRLIVQTINGTNEELPVITMKPELEQILQQSMQTMGEGNNVIEPNMAQKMQHSVNELASKQEILGEPAILVVQPLLRPLLAKLMKSALHQIHVLSYHEIPDNKQVKIVGTVG